MDLAGNLLGEYRAFVRCIKMNNFVTSQFPAIYQVLIQKLFTISLPELIHRPKSNKNTDLDAFYLVSICHCADQRGMDRKFCPGDRGRAEPSQA
ncbi:hypothetical protein TKWG_25215 [Advenella kashmirensis WT001]|uniref:Uncharacterized protein n=1 Tax=Advenella kashmirensis (strain DSM 17095 / LMG 22695 / WT001) TaxID=1036672 RepID=I3UHU6_ADVKW|nr:hypothetical protein TKWG_25215 [Advenella kashmirensis WT001]